jgi:CrcB protein
LAIAFFGALGSLCRYFLSQWAQRSSLTPYVGGTFLVNVLGCLLMGMLFGYFHQRLTTPLWLKAGLTVGFLGSFTTFSTYILEFHLHWQKHPSLALMTLLGQAVLGWAAVLLGLWLSGTPSAS